MKEKYELALEDYLAGMKQKDIAEKYDTTVNTVKSWSRRYEWAKKRKKCAPQNKSVHTEKECKKIAKEIVENESNELDEERQLFCIYYLKYHNMVKAYQKVKPKSKYSSACVMASRWYKEPAVQEEIQRLKQELYADALLDPQDVIQKYIDIAFSDSDELDGKVVKTADSLKALELLGKHMGLFTDTIDITSNSKVTIVDDIDES